MPLIGIYRFGRLGVEGKDAEGNLLKGVSVTIKGKKGRKSISTAKGNFKFMRLKDGAYTLVFKKKGYEVVEVGVQAPVKGVEVRMD